MRREPPHSRAGSPDHAASKRKTSRKSKADQRGQPDERWRPARGRDPHPAAAHRQRPWRERERETQSPSTLPPSRPKQHSFSKYRSVSLKRLRPCRPDAAPGPVAVNILGLPASFRLVRDFSPRMQHELNSQAIWWGSETKGSGKLLKRESGELC